MRQRHMPRSDPLPRDLLDSKRKGKTIEEKYEEKDGERGGKGNRVEKGRR